MRRGPEVGESTSRAAAEPALAIQNVRREFATAGSVRVAVDDVSFAIDAGQTIAVIGESGAGKSTLARIIAGLDAPTSGSVRVHGVEPRLQAGVPSPVQMVFQNPVDALDPFLSIGASIGEPMRNRSRPERRAQVEALLRSVGLDPARADERPSSFSGGQLQRVVIARALAARPRVLLCDEPTSALDVSVQAQIVNLLLGLQEELGIACVLITHDLAVGRVLADQIVVLRNGKLIEQGSAEDFFARPKHPYSASLLEAARTELGAEYARDRRAPLQGRVSGHER